MSKIAFITLGEMGGSMTINLRAPREAAAFAFVARLCRRSLTCARMIRLWSKQAGWLRAFIRCIGAPAALVGAAVNHWSRAFRKTRKQFGAFQRIGLHPRSRYGKLLNQTRGEAASGGNEDDFRVIGDSRLVDTSARRFSLHVSEAERRRRVDRASGIFAGRIA